MNASVWQEHENTQLPQHIYLLSNLDKYLIKFFFYQQCFNIYHGLYSDIYNYVSIFKEVYMDG